MQNQNEKNYLISIQTIDGKNNSSSLNNLNSINSININDKSQNNPIILPNENKYIFSSFFKNEFKKKKENMQFHSHNLLISMKKSYNQELFKYGIKYSLSKKRNKRFEVSTKKKKIYNPQYLTFLIENVEYKSKYGKILIKIKQIHLIISILLFLNIISSYIDNIINKNNSYDIIQKGYVNNNEYEKLLNDLKKRKLTKNENFLRIISLLTTLIIILLLIIKEILIYKHNLIYQTLNKRILIFIFSSFFFIPKINPIYIIKHDNYIYPIFIVDIFFLLNIPKIFVISYINLNFSKWGSAFSQLICYNYSIIHDYFFSIQAKLKNKPFSYLLFVFFIFLIIGIYLLRIFEFGTFLIDKTPIENYEVNLNSIINAIWLVLLSFFNIAFGDYYPKTIFSRFLFSIITFIGLIFLSFLLRNIMKFIIMTQSEKKVFIKMKRLYSHENLEYKSVKVIFYILKIRENKILYNKEENEYLKQLYLKNIICFFIILNRYIKNFLNNDKIDDIYSIPVDDLLNNVENKIKENLINFETSLGKLDTLENDLKQLLNIENQINKNVKIIISNQDYLGKFFIEINNLFVVERIKKSYLNKNSHQFNNYQHTNHFTHLLKNNYNSKIGKKISNLALKKNTKTNFHNNFSDSLVNNKNNTNTKIINRNESSFEKELFLSLKNPFLNLKNKGQKNKIDKSILNSKNIIKDDK